MTHREHDILMDPEHIPATQRHAAVLEWIVSRFEQVRGWGEGRGPRAATLALSRPRKTRAPLPQMPRALAPQPRCWRGGARFPPGCLCVVGLLRRPGRAPV